MTRIFGHYVSLEMILLCAVELLLSFIVIYAMLVSPAGGDASMAGPGAGAILWPSPADLAALLTFTIGATAVTIGLYRAEICLEWRRLLINAAVAGVLAFPAALLVSGIFSITLSHSYLLWLVKVMIAWIAVLMASRWAFRAVMRQDWFVRRVLVVGSGPRASRVGEVVRAQRARFFELAGVLPEAETDAAASSEGGTDTGTGSGADLAELRRRRVWGVVVASDRPDALPVRDLLHCKMRGVRVLSDVSFWEQHLGRIDLDHVDPNWFLFADGFSPSAVSDVIKRVSDIAISLAILILTLPLMLLTAVLIKLDSKGPIFYRQQRIGLFGQPFTVLKFRSMSVDAEAGGRAMWAARKDPRVTRVGGFIRSTRIDELPQLINVMRGDMSFIGPRPERPHFVDQLTQVIPFYHERSYVKPGITGWAQVNFPYGASIEDAREKLSYDLYYVKNRSFFLDVMILISTVRVILFQEGAR